MTSNQPNFEVGDLIRVHQKIQEGDKTRVQVFEGLVLAIKNRGDNRSFTVQKMVGEVGVERIFPVMSPLIAKIEIKVKAKKRIKRAKLYNLRVPKS